MVNKVILLGRLGREPEGTNTQSGIRIVKLSVATTERWLDKNTGEKQEKTEWHNIVIFNTGLGQVAEKYLRKGSLVYLEGQLQTRKWQDQSGNDRYTTEIVLKQFKSELTMISVKNDNASAQAPSAAQNASTATQGQPDPQAPPGYQGEAQRSQRPPAAGGDDPDNDIPF